MPANPDRLVQMNVRVPPAMRDEIDTRRRNVLDGNGHPVSRDEWCRRALAWALQQPNRTPIVTPTGRSPKRARTA